MTGTRNPSRKYFKRNQPYFYKSVDNWEEWDTDESYDRTFFIGIDDSNPEDIDVALYMIWGGKPIAVVGSKVLDTVSGVVDTAVLLEEEIQSILEEVQELTAAVAQARVDIEEAITEMGALVDRCEGILEGAEAARDLAREWATKIDGTVDGSEYSSKYYAYAAWGSEKAAADSATTAGSSATTAIEQATAASTSAGQAANSAGQAAGYASSANTDAGSASSSAQLAEAWAVSDTLVDGSDYSAKHYAGQASGSAASASASATDSSDFADAASTSAQDAQDTLDSVNGLIATPIGTVFQSIYVDEALDIARRLDGQLILSTKFTGFRAWLDTVQAYNPNLFTTEANWQAERTNSKLGQCGKFVIDDTAGTIRLPCVVNAQGLLSLSGIGNLVNESLPNITATVSHEGDRLYGASGAITLSGSASANGSGSSSYNTVNFNASRSSSTYQNGAPVQQEAVQYPYYIQVATGIEETLPAIREYEINTPFFFGQSMYSDVAPDNASWSASNGQWNARSIYPDYYDWLMEKRNSNTKTFYLWKNTSGDTVLFFTETNTLSVGSNLYGYNPTIKFGEITAISGNNVTFRNDVANTTATVSVNLSNPTYAGNLPVYDSSKMNVISKNDLDNWNIPTNTSDYDFVINTADQTFRLPLLNGEESLVGDRYNDLTLNTSGSKYTAPANGWFVLRKFSGTGPESMDMESDTGISSSTFVNGHSILNCLSVLMKRNEKVTINYYTTGATNLFRFIYAKGNGTLYFYVGDTVQDASLINAGAVLGQLATKTNSVEAAAASMPSGRYIDLTLGASGSTYTAPANGWFTISKIAGSDFYYVDLIKLKDPNGEITIPNILISSFREAYRTSPCESTMPVRKGDVVVVNYNATGSLRWFRFIYAEGDNNV